MQFGLGIGIGFTFYQINKAGAAPVYAIRHIKHTVVEMNVIGQYIVGDRGVAISHKYALFINGHNPEGALADFISPDLVYIAKTSFFCFA
ncbi:hypothetical protein D3C79_959680 [compost metagenome]